MNVSDKNAVCRFPTLSVCIPTYNSAHFLPDSIGSVLRQRLDNFELIVVDNDSQDETEAVVRGFNDSRIRYFRNSRNFGPHFSFDRCLRQARGTYIKYLCADDVFLDGVLLKQLRVLQTQPNVSLVTCDLATTDEGLQGREVHRAFPGACPGSRMINACLSGLGNYIGGPSSIMFRRSDALEISPDPSFKWVGDLRFGLKLLEKGDYVNINEVGFLYRRHPNTDTAINCPEEIRMPEYFRLADEFDWWNPLNCMQAIRRGGRAGIRAAREHWRRGCTPEGMQNAFKSFRDVYYMKFVRSFKLST